MENLNLIYADITPMEASAGTTVVKVNPRKRHNRVAQNRIFRATTDGGKHTDVLLTFAERPLMFSKISTGDSASITGIPVSSTKLDYTDDKYNLALTTGASHRVALCFKTNTESCIVSAGDYSEPGTGRVTYRDVLGSLKKSVRPIEPGTYMNSINFSANVEKFESGVACNYNDNIHGYQLTVNGFNGLTEQTAALVLLEFDVPANEYAEPRTITIDVLLVPAVDSLAATSQLKFLLVQPGGDSAISASTSSISIGDEQVVFSIISNDRWTGEVRNSF